MNFSKRSFIAALGLCALSLSLPAFAQSTLDTIMSSKTVKIGIPTDYPPYGFVGLDMKPQGLDIDMANLIAKKLGVKAELVPVVSANRIPYLQTKKIDLIVSTLGKNEERAKIIDFSHAYAPFYQGVFAPKSLAVKTFADLDGKTVATARGAMEDEMLTKLAPKGTIVKRFEDQAATTAAYMAGQTQAIAANVATMGVINQKKPEMQTEFKLLLRVSPCFVGVNKGESALMAKVNEIILEAKKDGTLNKMSQKWLKREAGDLPL